MQFLVKALERFWYGCGHCHAHADGVASCPLMNGNALDAPWIDPTARRFGHGRGLVGAVLLVFLMPLGTAAGGGYLADALASNSTGASLALWQMLGMLAGLAFGVGVAKLVMSLLNRRNTLCNEQPRSRGETE